MSWVMVAVLAAAPAVLDVRGGALEVREGHAVQRLSLGQLTRDGWACSPTLEARSDVGPRVVQARACGVRETFTDVSGGLEHEVVLATRPGGRGPLRVRLDVEGGWLGAERGAQRFGGPGLDGWRYGAASLVRPEGLVPLETRRVPGGLEVIVPEVELARPDAFPLHLDPLVTRGPLVPLDVDNRLSPSAGDESAPALAFSLDGTHFLAAWSDTRRSTNLFGAPETDLYLALINPLDGGRLELVKADPGMQDHPAVSAVDGGFVVAWEDKRLLNEVKVAFVARSPDAGALVLTGIDSIQGSSSPALSPLHPGRGVVLASVPSGAPQTVALRELGGMSLPSLNMGFNVAQVSVLAVESNVWVAATDGVSQSKLWKNESLVAGLLGGDRVELVADSSGVYVLVKNPTFGSPLAGVGLYRYDANMGAMQVVATFPAHVAPAASTFMGTGVVGAVSGGQLSLRRSPFTTNTVVTLDTTLELALAGSLDSLVAAYTTGPVGDRDLFWEVLLSPSGRGTAAPLAQTRASLRRNVRVAFLGDHGLAVWVSNREVHGRWLTRPPGNAELSFAQPFVLATESTAIGAVDLAFRSDGSAVVVWSVLSVGGSLLHARAWPLDSVVSNGSMSINPTSALVTTLDVESTGSAVYAAWRDGTLLRVVEVLASNPATSLFASSVVVSGSFDFSCSIETGKCVAVVEGASAVRTTTFPNATTPGTVTGTGPVAALMSNDQALVAVHRGTKVEVVDLADDSVVGSFPLASDPRSFALAGSPLVLAVADQSTVRLGVVGEGAFEFSVAGWSPDVALSLEEQGVLVITQDELPSASTTVTAQRFQVLPRDGGVDAGALDAGPQDAGSFDAGLSDAGVIDAGVELDAGVPDGGVGEPFVASGCSCDALSGAWATWLLVAWAVRRRR